MDWSRHPAVVAAQRIAPLAASCSDWIDRHEQLPDHLVAELGAAGLFQLYLPHALGGPEAHPLVSFGVTEALAQADGSTAWCISISTALSQYLAAYDPALVARLGGPCPDFRLAGSARPLGRARPVEGGCIVDGRWDFASNVRHADWYLGTCVIDDTGPAVRTRTALLPVGQVTVDPTWDALGMRGTGSHDVVVTDTFVPDDHLGSGRWVRARTEPIYHPRLAGIITWSPTAGVALGLARGALDAFVALAEGGSTRSTAPLRTRAEIQLATGRAEATLGAARAYLVETIEEAWTAVVERGPASDEPTSPRELDLAIARARAAITHAMGESSRVTRDLLEAAGTGGVFRTTGLERRFRDAHVAARHAAGLALHLESAGRVFLGLPADAPYF